MGAYRFWVQALSPAEWSTGFVPFPFADSTGDDEIAARTEARMFSRRYERRTVIADWEGPRFYYDGGRPVDMIEGMAWFVPPTPPNAVPIRPKFTDHEALRVFLTLTADEKCYREAMRRLDRGIENFVRYVRARHRNPHSPGHGRTPITRSSIAYPR